MIQENKDTTFEKVFGAALITAFIFVLLLMKCSNCKRTIQPTTTKIDTVYIEVMDNKSYIPKLDTIYYPKEKPRFRWDTIYIERMVLDTSEIDYSKGNWTTEITDDYFATRIYKDTIRNQYGSVIVKDTISANRIQGRGYLSDFKVPVVTKTITKEQKKRNQLYFGGGVFGNETKVLSGYEAGLMFKTKQDRVLNLSYNQIFNGQHYYKAGIYFKLSFRKQ